MCNGKPVTKFGHKFRIGYTCINTFETFTFHISGRGNRIGPVCVSVCLCVRLSALSRRNRHVTSQNDVIWAKGLNMPDAGGA